MSKPLDLVVAAVSLADELASDACIELARQSVAQRPAR
jgi:hypothetical protein